MTPEWPWALRSQKYPVYTEYSPQGPNFTPFRSTVARFPDNWGVWFLHKVQWWNQKFVKNRKLKILKIQNSTFVRTSAKKIREKVEKIQKSFEGGVAFWSFGSHRVPCSRNGKKNPEKSILKNPNLLSGSQCRKFRKGLKDSKVSWGSSSFLTFWLSWDPMLTKTKNIFKNSNNVWGYGPREATTKIWKKSVHKVQR